MNQETQEKLHIINKMIFVQQYSQALEQLNALLEEPTAKDQLLLHLRRIELSLRMQNQEELRDQYLKSRHQKKDAVVEICLALLDQQTGRLSPKEAVQSFQILLEEYGQHAALYYGIACSFESQGNVDRAISNYKMSLELDTQWYPAYFGLSQLFYQRKEEENGDYYFYLFEKFAPYNLYGNFDTHRVIAQECLKAHQFPQARKALSCLRDWWKEQKGFCPPEVELYEQFFFSEIAKQSGDQDLQRQHQTNAITYIEDLLAQPISQDTGYFVFCTVEAFGGKKLADQVCKQLLAQASPDSEIVQKIATHFFTAGKSRVDLFEGALQANPDHPDLGFCTLVARLKKKKIPIEPYLEKKKLLKKMLSTEEDPLLILECLRELLAQFDGDAQVHSHFGEVYLELGNQEKSFFHYQKMMELEPGTPTYLLQYTHLLLKMEQLEPAAQMLDVLMEKFVSTSIEEKLRNRFCGMQFTYHYKSKKYEEAYFWVSQLTKKEPWNVIFLLDEIRCLLQLRSTLSQEGDFSFADTMSLLASEGNQQAAHRSLGLCINELNSTHEYELAYKCQKLSCLFFQEEESILSLVSFAPQIGVQKIVQDFLRLLNTNFDGSTLYLAIGLLYKASWQLEAAATWFESGISYMEEEDDLDQRMREELADCYLWQGVCPGKALEMVKVYAGDQATDSTYMIAAHGSLQVGKPQEASLYLSRIKANSDFEFIYLQGLLQFRNGKKQEARKIWKPLISAPCEKVRFYHMKEQLLKYYFNEAEYEGLCRQPLL